MKNLGHLIHNPPPAIEPRLIFLEEELQKFVGIIINTPCKTNKKPD